MVITKASMGWLFQIFTKIKLNMGQIIWKLLSEFFWKYLGIRIFPPDDLAQLLHFACKI